MLVGGGWYGSVVVGSGCWGRAWPLWTRQPICCFRTIHHHGSGLPIAKRAKLPQGGRNLVAASVLDEPLRRDTVVHREHNVKGGGPYSPI
jgi:hypothetical protein